MTENQKAYNAKYIKENQRQFMLKVNKLLDPEMVTWLESKDNIQQYLKQLIREDMEKHQTRT